MKRVFFNTPALFVLLLLLPATARATTDFTFHFHKEGNTSQSLLYLLTSGPDDSTPRFSESPNLKNFAMGSSQRIPSLYRYLSTAPGTRVVPANSVFEFKLWMLKTASWGDFYPKVTLSLFDNYNNPNVGGTQLCEATLNSSIPSQANPSLFTVNCSVSSQVVIGPNQVLVATVEAYVASAPGNHNVTVRFYYEGTANGNYDSRLKFPYDPWTGPVIASLSPISDYPTTLVTVSGSGFGATQGSSTLKFNGSAVSPTSWSDTSIQFNVPLPMSSGLKSVNVTVGGVTSNTNWFNVLQPPTPSITSLTPSTASVGQTVTVAGTSFGNTQGQSTLTLNGTSITPNTWSSTSIQFTVPIWGTTGPVRVNVLGVNSNTQTLTVLRPTISSLSPSTTTVGSTVTVNGSNFGSPQGSSTLALDGTTITPSSWGASAIQFTVPSWATKGDITVTVNSVVSNASTLTVTPVISSLSPSTGPVGTAVTVNGTGFGSTQGTSTLKYDGIAMTPTSWSSTAIGFVVPIRPTASVVITVKGVNSAGSTFTVTAPVISNITPTSGGVGTYVTITGTGFGNIQSSSEVRFNGSISNPVSWSNTSIITPVQGTSTTGPLTVRVAGLDSNGVTFTVASTGTITGIVRRASDQAPLSGVEVKAIRDSIVRGTTTSASDGTYTLSGLPTGLMYDPSFLQGQWYDAGLYDLVATATNYLSATFPGTRATGGATTTVNFLLYKPSITSVTPPSGPIATSVTIKGLRFGATQGTSTVTFNGTTATPTTWTDTKIVTTVPSGATTGSLVVTVSGAASDGVTFGVGTGTVTGTITDAGTSAPINGAFVEVLRSNAVVATTTSGMGGGYTVANVLPDIYDVRFSAATYGTTVSTGNVVSANNSTTVNGALPGAGTISGTITKADGITPISGANVTILTSGAAVATVFTNGSGVYTATGVAPGTYSVQASAAGYVAQTQSGAVVTVGNTTTKNFSLLGQSAISYAYDTLGRLIGVTDSLGDTATYTYDAVGNITAINRYSSALISIVGFAPTHGAIGTQVTIYGTAFSPTPSSNTVTLNGTSATVTAASTTQLVVTVPSGATTGTIGVTSPAGSTTSSSVFSIP